MTRATPYLLALTLFGCGTAATGPSTAPQAAPEVPSAAQDAADALAAALTGKPAFRAVRVRTDDLGMTQVRFTHTQQGLPVFGSEAIVVTRPDGTVRAVRDQVRATQAVDPTPTVSLSAARTAALDGLDREIDATRSTLGILPQAGGDRLVWRIRVEGASVTQELVDDVDIDAHTGEVLARTSQIAHSYTHSVIPATGQSAQDGVVDIMINEVVNNDTDEIYGHFMFDFVEGINVYDASGLYVEDGWIYGAVWFAGDGPDTWDVDAVEGMFHTAGMRTMISDLYGWDGFNGDGTHSGWDWNGWDVTRVWVDIPHTVYSGAAFVPSSSGWYMRFSSGDGYARTSAARADIIGHEYGHGLVEGSVDLVYSDESGSLNEAFADVMGNLYEHQLRGDNPETNWLVGEEIVGPGWQANYGPAVRSLAAPYSILYRADHTSIQYLGDENNGGVHRNAGIPGHQFYLMVNGGTHARFTERGTIAEGLGWDDAAEIWFRAYTTYLTSSAQFEDARDAMVLAAEDLYGAGSMEVAVVEDAWHLVGVGDASSDLVITPLVTDLAVQANSDGTCTATLEIESPESVVVAPYAGAMADGAPALLDPNHTDPNGTDLGAYTWWGPTGSDYYHPSWETYTVEVAFSPEGDAIALAGGAIETTWLEVDCGCLHADISGDGVVDDLDITWMRIALSTGEGSYDPNGDGAMTIDDLRFMATYYGESCD